MKRILEGKTGNILLAVAGAAALFAAAWYVFDLGKVIEVGGAVRDIVDGRNVAKARTRLELANDRGYVLRRLEEALEDEDGTVRGKANLLQTLGHFSRPRAVRRALDSRSLATQRAACTLLHADPDLKARCGEIAIAWLRDEGADERWHAAMICGRLELPDTRAVLLQIVERTPRTPDELRLFQQALYALKDPKPKELVERLLAMAVDRSVKDEVRGAALDALERTKEGPRDRLLEIVVGAVADPSEALFFRQKAAVGLGAFPEERAWKALEQVLFSEEQLPDPRRKLEFHVLQRHCLQSIGKTAPIDRVRELLLDNRVYQHPYFGIRVDVATGLAALDVREGITLDILCNYLVDDDRQDTEHVVRSEAWLTLWVLTGHAQGVRQEDSHLFRFPPRPFTDRESAREFLFLRAYNRSPPVTRDQVKAAERIAQDLPEMQKVRQSISQSLRGVILQKWKEEAEKAAKPKEPQAPPAPQGPQPPQGPQEPGAQEPKKEEEAPPQEPEREGSGEPDQEEPGNEEPSGGN